MNLFFCTWSQNLWEVILPIFVVCFIKKSAKENWEEDLCKITVQDRVSEKSKDISLFGSKCLYYHQIFKSI